MAEINVQINQYKQLTNNYDQLHPETGAEITSLTPETQAKFPSGILNTDAALAYLAESSVGNAKNVTATYPVAAGKVISQGDIVDIVNGEVTDKLTSISHVITALGSNKNSSYVTMLDNIVGIYTSKSPSGNAVVEVLKVNTTNHVGITRLGRTTVIDTNATTQIRTTRLSNTRFLFTYLIGGNLLKYKVGDYNTTTNIVNVYSSSYGDSTITYSYYVLPLAQNKFITMVSSGNFIRCRIGTIVGTETINFTDEFAFDMGKAQKNLCATILEQTETDTKIVLTFLANSDNSGNGFIIHTDGTTITAGEVYNFFMSGSMNPVINQCCSSGNDFIMFYNITDKMYACLHKVNGNVIDNSIEPIQIGSGFNQAFESNTLVQLTSNSGIFVSQNATNLNGIAYSYIRNEDNLIFSNQYSFGNIGALTFMSGSKVSDNQIMVVYNTNTAIASGILLGAIGNQIGGYVSNNASTAISLSNSTAGQLCNVIYSGIIAAPWITENQIITSDGQGVYGLGVLDGFLQVYAKNRPGKIVTGTYAGNGTYGSGNPNTITFAPGVKAVFIGDIGQGGGTNCIVGLWTPFMYRGSINVNQSTDLIWTATSLKWYSLTNAYDQMNSKDITYHYVLFY